VAGAIQKEYATLEKPLSFAGSGAAMDTRPAHVPPSDRRAHTARRGMLPWAVLVCGAAFSILVFLVISNAIEERAQLRFERETAEAKGLIDLRIQFHTSVLYGLRAFFSTQQHVSRLDFHRHVEALHLSERYPGFDLVNYAARVLPHERRQFEEAVRADTSLDPRGYPDFRIRPPGERSEYHVIVYIEPMEPFRYAFGLDVAANPVLKADNSELLALQHETRDSGHLIASGRPIRVKRNPEYIGLALRLAVYRTGMPLDTVEQRRAAFIGTVGAGFNVQNLMKDVLSTEMAEYMRFRLFDVGPAQAPAAARLPPAHERLLFDNRQQNLGAPALEPENVGPAYFNRDLTTAVGGRLWQIRFEAPRNAVIDTVDATLPWFILIGGLFTTTLLTGFLYSLSSSERRAVALANDMTKDLRENRTLLNEAQKLAHVGCCQYDPRDGSMIWSEELHRIFGVPDSFAPSLKAMIELVHPQEQDTVRAAIDTASSVGGPFTFECRIVRPDGTTRHVRSLGEVISDAGGLPQRMLWSVLDITEHRETEHALRSSADQLTALSRRLVEIQETERRSLSRELHDRVGQNLTALSINLDILATSLARDEHTEQRARIQDSASLLESTVDSIENVMAELRPPMLDDYGLLPALHWYAKDFSKRTGIEVAVHGDDHADRLEPGVEIALFRIAQEALTNVLKHARATRVDISLKQDDAACIMTLTDDGVGIDSRSRGGSHRHGLGMVTMRERSQAVGGRFSARSRRGGGTEIEITIP